MRAPTSTMINHRSHAARTATQPSLSSLAWHALVPPPLLSFCPSPSPLFFVVFFGRARRDKIPNEKEGGSGMEPITLDALRKPLFLFNPTYYTYEINALGGRRDFGGKFLSLSIRRWEKDDTRRWAASLPRLHLQHISASLRKQRSARQDGSTHQEPQVHEKEITQEIAHSNHPKRLLNLFVFFPPSFVFRAHRSFKRTACYWTSQHVILKVYICEWIWSGHRFD